ncbi:MAG: hypothetical protein GOV02_00030 [Candidatus Aenigmarchaeota archaeon]|nr:hypothetical protein [Candidatus Aenigmarchaeota archaeon]
MVDNSSKMLPPDDLKDFDDHYCLCSKLTDFDDTELYHCSIAKGIRDGRSSTVKTKQRYLDAMGRCFAEKCRHRSDELLAKAYEFYQEIQIAKEAGAARDEINDLSDKYWKYHSLAKEVRIKS